MSSLQFGVTVKRVGCSDEHSLLKSFVAKTLAHSHVASMTVTNMINIDFLHGYLGKKLQKIKTMRVITSEVFCELILERK